MRDIRIADMTMRAQAAGMDYSLSFKEKLELIRELDRLGVDVIEFAPMAGGKTDQLLIHTAATLVKGSALSCPTGLTAESLDAAWAAVREAAKPRLLVNVPVSTLQMEYVCKRKPDEVLKLIAKLVRDSADRCADVEFSAEDATRADFDFLCAALTTAIGTGARTVSVCDTAGTMLPDEMNDFITRLYAGVRGLAEVTLSVECADGISMAAACAFAAIGKGAGQVKATANGAGMLSLEALSGVLRARGDSLGVRAGLDMTALTRSLARMTWLTSAERSNTSAFGGAVGGETAPTVSLDGRTEPAELGRVLGEMGYEVSEEELSRIYEAFRRIADKKTVGAKELDAIVAGAALQIPETYKLMSYVINSGNLISATANIVLEKDGEQRRGLVVGDGPVDAAFLAVEQAVGRHYELDDFQISAVTEGREAMGSTLVKLRSGGRLYSGQGVSTDVIGASIRAYVDALNKIAYEENM